MAVVLNWLTSREVVSYLDSKIWHLEVRCLYETPILLTYIQVYMKEVLNLSCEMFTFLSYHLLTIGIQVDLYGSFCICIKASLTIFNSTTPLKINIV